MPQQATTTGRIARLFRNGRNQAVRIPREFEFAGGEVLLRREGRQLIVEEVETPGGLLETLRGLSQIEESFPDIDETLLPTDEIAI